ncbi:hypothetical protein FSPOR_6455 [Fusarium sporotrichioides]|uniref:Uncharacterized protein n=1 Tax=Fusarium sporotrichioides TaxID=5514 RepID=A0A395S3A0_FUSSP|nr:hypothetical protein FSPOR_6455 [Fusarium sporotrichioides]
MAPSEFFIRLQKGITGGFAPPTLSLIISMQVNGDDLQISINRNTVGDMSEESRTVAIVDHEDTIDKLGEILHELPTEDPPGSEDIYGLDTGIAWGSEDLEWWNGGPNGVGGGQSSVQPTPEQKNKFKRAVEIVYKIAGEE